MVYLVTILQTTKNGNRIFHGRFFYHNRLEPTFQSRILFNILTVFIQCGRTDTMKLTTGQHRLQHIAGIKGSVCLACTDNRMQLINKQDDLTITVLHILKHGFQTLLEFTTILRTCNQCTHIQCKNLLILQSFRNITIYNPLCKPFHNRGLTNTGFTNQNRVILRLTGKDTNHIPDLLITADDRIKLLLSCFLHKILTVLLQGIIGCFRIIGGYPLIATHSR